MPLLVAFGAVVYWPGLTTGFFLDDYLHSAMVHGRFPGIRGPFTLYDFVSDDNRAALLARGFLPWWADAHVTLRFLRPLASALLFYEHRWLDAWPVVMHVHSFAWWVAAVFVARALFRTVVAPRAASIATVIFALAPCHALPVGWLANREALISLVFGTVGLVSILRWQAGKGAWWAALAFVAFALGLCAGEYTLGCAGYLALFAWTAKCKPARRWVSVLTFGVPLAAYMGVRRALGYGAFASGFYLDPLHDPLLFLRHAPWRFACLIMRGWFSQEPGTWDWGTPATVIVAAGAFVIGARLALVHVTEQLEPDARRTTWTLVWGSILALLPMLTALPSPRLLGAAMLGVSPVVGVLLDSTWFRRDAEARHGAEEWTAIVATLLGFAHLVHSPAAAWANARLTRTYSREFADHAADLARRLAAKTDHDVVIVRGLDDVFFYGFAIDALGVEDTHWTVLSRTGHVLCVRRDASTLELVAATGLFPASGGDLYRSEVNRIVPGDSFHAGELTARVDEVDPFGPRRVRFHFGADVADPRWTWVGESRERGFYDATPPKVGFGAPFDP